MTYNKSTIYHTEIEPVVKKLTALCYEKGLPCFISVALANNDEGWTDYASDLVSPDKVNVELNDDHISRHVNILNGFHTKLPDEPVVLDF